MDHPPLLLLHYHPVEVGQHGLHVVAQVVYVSRCILSDVTTLDHFLTVVLCSMPMTQIVLVGITWFGLCEGLLAEERKEKRKE